MGVGRIGISQQVELEDLDRIFYVARALIILSDDVHGSGFIDWLGLTVARRHGSSNLSERVADRVSCAK